MPTIKDRATHRARCPTWIDSSADFEEIERSYHLVFDISEGRTGGTLMVRPEFLLFESPDLIQSRIISSFAAVTEAEHYRQYARLLASWLIAFHCVNPHVTRQQLIDLGDTTSASRRSRNEALVDKEPKTQQQAGVVAGDLDPFGFPLPTISDSDSIDSLGTERFGNLHWRVARIHADLIDLPYSFVELIDLHILLIYIECVLTSETFDGMTLMDAQMVGVRARFDVDYQQPDIIAMVSRLQAILDDDDFQHLSEITDECVGEPMEEQSNVETEFTTDEDGFPVKSTESKHEQYVDSVDNLVMHLTMLKMLSEKRKVRNFTKKAKIRVNELKEAIAEFDEIDTLKSEACEIGEVTSSQDINSAPQSHTMRSDALSIGDAQTEFMENTTDIDGKSPPKQSANTMGFTKRMPDMYSSTPQKPKRNAPASLKLGNTNVNLSGVAEEYHPDRKAGSEFFAFG